MSARPTTTELDEALAVCQGCDFRVEGAGALGSAARHYDATGHPVITRITRSIHYGAARDYDRVREDAGQETMNL